MGKPFAREMDHLRSTFEWAIQSPLVEQLTRFVRDSAEHGLLAVGSGGSMTGASLAAQLHQGLTGLACKAITPLELRTGGFDLRRHSVLHVTAGGRNQDILAGYRFARAEDAVRQAILVARGESPLAELASGDDFAYSVCFDLAAGKDGFLATNSLLATVVLLLRAYATWLPYTLPTKFPVSMNAASVKNIRQAEHVIALHGDWTTPVAIDLESKFSEAALGSLQLADYRNFGHGRHNWLAKRGERTLVVALVNPSLRRLADATLDLIPDSIGVVRLETTLDGPAGIPDLLIRAFQVIDQFGKVIGIDPGRPGVPEFGTKLYGLRPRFDRDVAEPTPPVKRKIAGLGLSRLAPSVVSDATKAFSAFVAHLADARVGAIAFDYDGTLCDARKRFDRLDETIVRHLETLTEAGIVLGIATGRGKSVRKELQEVLPRTHWDAVLIGYYNGLQIAPLSDDFAPASDDNVIPPLADFALVLEDATWLKAMLSFEVRSSQITVHAKIDTGPVASVLRALLARQQIHGLQVVSSSHSIDIIPVGRGKLALFDRLASASAKTNSVVLAIGDKGSWPGNDYALLSSDLSLSVDEVSPDLRTCWNIAPAGMRGISATKYYLSRLKIRRGIGRFDVGAFR